MKRLFRHIEQSILIFPDIRTGTALDSNVKFAVEIFKQYSWSINYSQSHIIGQPTILPGPLQILLDAGTPVSKDLFKTCRENENRSALAVAVRANPQLASKLTPEELVDCLKHAKWSKQEVEEIVSLISKKAFGAQSEWLTYLVSRRLQHSALLQEGWPCVTCDSCLRCMMPVLAAIQQKDISLLKQLIEDDFEVGRPSTMTVCKASKPLILALCLEVIDAVDLLLGAGADANTRDFGVISRTVLQEASWSRHFKAVQSLIRAEAQVNNRADICCGNTALERAAFFGCLDIVHLLVANSPDARRLKHDCRRAARWARVSLCRHLARSLEQHAAALEKQMGRDDIDDVIDESCDCLVMRYPIHDMHKRCKAVFEHPRSLCAFLIYYTNAIPSGRDQPSLKRDITGDETLEEIEDLLVFHPENLKQWREDMEEGLED